LKPTYGRVSRRGVLPMAQTLDTCGPMAWTVEDCALLLEAMAGHDPADPASIDAPVPHYHAALDGKAQGLRIGVVRHFYARRDGASEDVVAAIDAALGVLRGLGASIADVTLPDLGDFHACGRAIVLSEVYALHRATVRARPKAYGQSARERVRLGAFVGAEEYLRAQRFRRRLVERTLAAMEGFDLLVTANEYGPPPRFGEVPLFPYFGRPFLAMPFNLTGQPALALCCGFDRAGLPLSLQIVGRVFDEAAVLRLGHAYERATQWRARRPAL
jgi:aspartyl-tRNA(Asn)/glutamyl-tRNA(Gln) amidotransferase subunit A